MIKILCADGVKRTNKEYREWIKFLKDVFEQEPNDLTSVEKLALEMELKL